MHQQAISMELQTAFTYLMGKHLWDKFLKANVYSVCWEISDLFLYIDFLMSICVTSNPTVHALPWDIVWLAYIFFYSQNYGLPLANVGYDCNTSQLLVGGIFMNSYHWDLLVHS